MEGVAVEEPQRFPQSLLIKSFLSSKGVRIVLSSGGVRPLSSGHRGVDTTPSADRNVSGSDYSGVMDSWAGEVERALSCCEG